MKPEYLFKMKPETVIEYFQKKDSKETWSWQDIWNENHAKAFTVAKSMNLDILDDIRSAMDTAIAEGRIFAQFKKELMTKLKQNWGSTVAPNVESEKEAEKIIGYRLKTIYQTNLSSAYAVGHYKNMMLAAPLLPYWQYRAVDDPRTRRSHKELNGMIFHYTHPFWQTHFPPNGFRCRCTVVSMSEKKAKSKGFIPNTEGTTDWVKLPVPGNAPKGTKAKEAAVFVLEKDGKTIRVMADPSFSQNPGAAAVIDDYTFQKIQQKKIPDKLKQQYISEIAMYYKDNPPDISWWLDKAINQKEDERIELWELQIGVLSEKLIEAVKPKSSYAIIFPPDKPTHVIRPKHGTANLSMEQAAMIPDVINNPDAVYLDGSSLIYTKKIEEKKVNNDVYDIIKVVVTVNSNKKNRRGENSLSTAILSTEKKMDSFKNKRLL